MKTYSDCRAVREELSGFLDGELTHDERAGIESHLAECSDCLRELDSLKRVDAAYANLSSVSAPAGFEQSVRDALHPTIVPMKRPGATRRMWGGALAMAATVALVSGVVLWPSVEQGERFEVASELATEGAAPAKSEAISDRGRLTEQEVEMDESAGIAESKGFDVPVAEKSKEPLLEAAGQPKSVVAVGGIKKETQAIEKLSATDLLESIQVELERSDEDSMIPEDGFHELRDELKEIIVEESRMRNEIAQRESQVAQALDSLESKDKVSRRSGIVGGAMLKPVYEDSMTDDEAKAQKAADEAFRADALKQDLNRESITENGVTFRPNTPLPPSSPTAKSKTDTLRLQDARQLESELRRRILGQRGVGDKVLRSFEQREGVWYESGYRDQKLITVERDSSELQRILVENPDLSEIVSWRAKVVFRVKGTWYALQAPKD